MNHRVLKRILDSAIDTLSRPSQLENDNYRIARTGLKVAISSLVISTLIGLLGIYLVKVQIDMAKKQDSTSLDISNFNKLLIKMDTMLTRQSSLNTSLDSEVGFVRRQLTATSSMHEVITNNNRLQRKGDIFRFIATLNAMRDAATFYRVAKRENSLNIFDSAVYRIYVLDKQRELMESQLTNSVLMIDTNINLCWLVLYNSIATEQATNKFNFDHGMYGDYKGARRRFESSMELLHNSIDTLLKFSSKQTLKYTKYNLKID